MAVHKAGAHVLPHIVVNRTPDQTLIASLASLFERAQKGEVIGFAGVVVYDDLNQRDIWSYDDNAGTILLGNLHLMVRDLENEMLRGD